MFGGIAIAIGVNGVCRPTNDTKETAVETVWLIADCTVKLVVLVTTILLNQPVTRLLVFVANFRKHPTPLLLIRAAADDGILCATDPVTVIVVPDWVAVQVPAPKKGASNPFIVLIGGLNFPPAILLISFIALNSRLSHCQKRHGYWKLFQKDKCAYHLTHLIRCTQRPPW